MTPNELQDALVEELKEMLSDYTMRTPYSTERKAVSVYKQSLPVLETDDEEGPVPYIIVRLQGGNEKIERDSSYTVKLTIIIATWDDSLDMQGYQDVMNIINRIYIRFHKSPNLKNIAQYAGEWNWAIQEEDYYPYFFGACSMEFVIAAVRREDEFA